MTDPAPLASPKKRVFVIFDGRAAGGVGTDDALVHADADTLEEARRDKRDVNGAIYEYDDNDDGTLTNERFVE